jgi:hypothetical protein
VPLEYQGAAAIGAFMRASSSYHGGLESRLVASRANGQPAFGCYVAGAVGFEGHGLIVLTLEGGRISAITRFVDNGLLERFGLPSRLAG